MAVTKSLLNFSRSSADVCTAACTCPAGTGTNCLGKCNHVGAILFSMEDFNRKGLKEFHEPLTCTSRLSKWNVPRDSSSVPAPIDSVVIKKIKFGDQPHAEIHPKINKYDPRASFHKNVDQNALGILKRKLQSCLIESNFLLCHNLPSICVEGEPRDIYCEEVSFDGTDNFETILAYHL